MSNKGYSLSPSPLGIHSPNHFSAAISSLRTTYQEESASQDALQYIDTVLRSRSSSPTSPSQLPHGNHEHPNTNTVLNTGSTSRPRSHSVTPKVSPIVSPIVTRRSPSTGNNDNETGIISRMRSAAFDESQNIAQPIPTHPAPDFLSSDFPDSEINTITGTLLSLPALMDKPQASNFPSSTDPSFVLQNIFATNVNDLLQNKGYVPSSQVKDMGKAIADHVRTCIGSGFDSPQEEKVIQTDLLARMMAYAAIELQTEIADYTVASHGSKIPLIIYRKIQEDWDFSGNSDNHLITNTAKTIQDDLDEAFTNRQHKNIMAITSPAMDFTIQDKHTIMDAITNDTPLPEQWAFVDEKGHKRTTFAWLSGHPSPKKSIAPTTTFSPTIGQKRPLEDEQDNDDLSYADKLEAIKYRLPMPQSTVDANVEAWTKTINKYLDNARRTQSDIHPTTLRARVIQTAERLMKREYFVNRIKKVARTKDHRTLQDFDEERLRSLRNEINLTSNSEDQDTTMIDPPELSKTELIRKSTAIWKNTAKTLRQENILTCKPETLDQATRLLLLNDSTHKYASLSEAEIYDMELDRRDAIIAKITKLNENASKVIQDIKQKSTTTANKGKLALIKKQGWDTAKRVVTQNPTKFSPANLPTPQYLKIVSDIIDNLKDKEDDTWETKILKDVKNKGLQAKALDSRVQTIVRRLNNLPLDLPSTNPPSSPRPPPSPRPLSTVQAEQKDQVMDTADPIPWTDTEDYKQNRQLWINSASETFEKLAPYFQLNERKQKEELFWEAADICTHQDKDLLQLQSISSFTDSNKKRELENMRKLLIDKEYQSLLNATHRQAQNQKKDEFEDYLASKDFDYYVQQTKEQISNPAVPKAKKITLNKLLQEAEKVKWQPKHRVDDDGSILPDSPPPSPPPKQNPKKQDKQKTSFRKAAEQTRKGNTPNTCHLQKLLNELNADNGQKIMKEIHKISEKDKLLSAQKQLTTPTVKPTAPNPTYAQKSAPKNNKDPRKDGAGGWKTVGGNNKITRPTILPPPPNVFKFFVTDDENTLPNKRQTEEELTSALNNIISENVEWLLELGSNHIKSANWSKDPKAIVVTMTRNIDKDRTDDLPDGKAAFDTLKEVVMDLFPGSTLANRKPRSKLKFTRVPTQHSDGLPMDNGLLYHYIRKHPNFENVHFSLTPRFERPHPLKPGQTVPSPKNALDQWSSSMETPAYVRNSFSDHLTTKRIAPFANGGTTPQSSANSRRTSALDAEAHTRLRCTQQHATCARKARYARSNASKQQSRTICVHQSTERKKQGTTRNSEGSKSDEHQYRTQRRRATTFPQDLMNDHPQKAEIFAATYGNIACQNVAKNIKHLHGLLDSLANTTDILMVQETPFYLVKHAPSFLPDGKPVYGSVVHPAWTCAHSFNIYQDTSQVATFVNNRLLTNHSLFVDTDSFRHHNILVTKITNNITEKTSTIINVYNNPYKGPKNDAVKCLINGLPACQDVNVIQGDFNLHHTAWDTLVNETPELGTALLHATFIQGLSLISPPSFPTHYSKHHTNRVLDLAFTRDHTRTQTTCSVELEKRGSSDHALISIKWKMESDPYRPPYIKKDSKEELSFLTEIGDKEWWSPPDETLSETEQTKIAQRNFTTLYETIHESWQINSKTGSVKHPMPWWNKQCQKAKDEVSRVPTQQNRQEYQTQIHLAHQSYY
ncbi:hypothetical protein AMATHDRAFT_10245 [Amanita thiersii Skay4041]|uniref:Endonuclease/exonuclease/phosphatase domain-containing protein n=1 Tax=Amanita thiersii Skay4041 TaxID=703135 RepID=A0A2A9N6V9_9AGAR|nr:hypothetical protein AMATHDRAFT_10245 [Amanita thiersii Skay4041]